MLGAYLIWKIIKKTAVVPLDSIPLLAALDQVDLYPDMPEPKQTGWLRTVSWLWN